MLQTLREMLLEDFDRRVKVEAGANDIEAHLLDWTLASHLLNCVDVGVVAVLRGAVQINTRGRMSGNCGFGRSAKLDQWQATYAALDIMDLTELVAIPISIPIIRSEPMLMKKMAKRIEI